MEEGKYPGLDKLSRVNGHIRKIKGFLKFLRSKSIFLKQVSDDEDCHPFWREDKEIYKFFHLDRQKIAEERKRLVQQNLKLATIRKLKFEEIKVKDTNPPFEDIVIFCPYCNKETSVNGNELIEDKSNIAVCGVCNNKYGISIKYWPMEINVWEINENV